MTPTITPEDVTNTLRARIEAVREELGRYDVLRQELERLETALVGLERVAPAPAAPSSDAGNGGEASATRAKPRKRTRARRSAAGAATAARGETRAKIISFIADNGPATAHEVAEGLGMRRNSVATRLTQLAREGALEKADRGYRVPAR